VTALVDQRERVGSVPAAFAGNAVCWMSATVAAGAPLSATARALHDQWQPYTCKPSPLLTHVAQTHAENLAHDTGYCVVDFDSIAQRKPSSIYTNSFVKFPVYVDFGQGPAQLVIPQHTGDPLLLFPSPGGGGGVDVYFQSGLAEALLRAEPDHPVWARLLVEPSAAAVAQLMQQRGASHSYRRHCELQLKQLAAKAAEAAPSPAA